MGMQVKPSHGYPKANRNAGSRLAQPRWCGQRRLGTQISSGSLHPVSSASRIPESPRRRDFASPTVLDDRAHDRHSHSLRFGREESIKEPWHALGIDALPGAEPRCGCARCPTARCSLPLLESLCFSTLTMRAYRRPEFRTNRHCIASPPPLAYFCDVCRRTNSFRAISWIKCPRASRVGPKS